MDPESESEALSIAPDAEEDPEVEVEEEDEGEGEVEEEDEEGNDGDEGEEGDDGDEVEEEGEDADEAEEEAEDEEAADDGDGDAVQESDLDELSSPSTSPPPAQTAPSRTSRLKITLKLPTQKPTRVRRSTQKEKDPDSGVESEDDDDQPRGSKRPLTTRQAVLASVVGSSHVSLDETSRKKKQLNEAEIALRREETARKRKHLSEKKLEDEKAETINRLLKKKSGTRNRRNALASADDRTPATQTGNGTPAEGEPEEEESGEVAPVPIVEVVPTYYRWISTTRPAIDAPPGEEKMTMSFSVPASLLPTPLEDGDGDIKMEAQEQPPKSLAPAVCNVDGCTASRKYRLVRDSEQGACGMGHLHLLETQPRAVAA